MKMSKTLRICAGAVLAALGLGATSAFAGAIAQGDIVVYRIGTGTGSLVNTGNSVFVDEFTTGGAPVQSIAMPDTSTGINLIASGTASSEGGLTVSPNGQYVTLTGYNRAVGGTGSISGTTSATVNRVIGVIPVATGSASLTALTDYSSGNNPRSAVTTDGNTLWAVGGAGGVITTTVGSTTSTQIAPTAPATLANFRQINIFDGQLYAGDQSTSGGNTAPLVAVGSGTPTTNGQVYNALPGLPAVTGVAGTTSSFYAYFFADLDNSVAGVDTVYVADDGTTYGGINKFSLVSGSWVNNGKVGTSADAYRGVTGYADALGVHLFATRKGGTTATGGGELVSLLDNTGYNVSIGTPAVTLLATAGANQAFRGVGYIPVSVPEPSTLMLAGAGLVLGVVTLRRRIG